MQGLLQRNRGAKKSLSKAKEIGGKRKHFRFVIGPSPEGPTNLILITCVSLTVCSIAQQ